MSVLIDQHLYIDVSVLSLNGQKVHLAIPLLPKLEQIKELRLFTLKKSFTKADLFSASPKVSMNPKSAGSTTKAWRYGAHHAQKLPDYNAQS